MAKSEKQLEQDIVNEEKSLRAQLDSFKKVSIEIPEDPNNPDEVLPVGWNGIIYGIPVGQQFEVPEPIYKIWKESHEKTKEANKRIRDSIKKEIQVL
jgi:hypothetical protein